VGGLPVLDARELLGSGRAAGVVAEEVVELGGRLPVAVTGRGAVGLPGGLVGDGGDVLGGLGVGATGGRQVSRAGYVLRGHARVSARLGAVGGHLGGQRARAHRGYELRRPLVGG
jgi:hypothetical protein